MVCSGRCVGPCSAKSLLGLKLSRLLGGAMAGVGGVVDAFAMRLLKSRSAIFVQEPSAAAGVLREKYWSSAISRRRCATSSSSATYRRRCASSLERALRHTACAAARFTRFA